MALLLSYVSIRQQLLLLNNVVCSHQNIASPRVILRASWQRRALLCNVAVHDERHVLSSKSCLVETWFYIYCKGDFQCQISFTPNIRNYLQIIYNTYTGGITQAKYLLISTAAWCRPKSTKWYFFFSQPVKKLYGQTLWLKTETSVF